MWHKTEVLRWTILPFNLFHVFLSPCIAGEDYMVTQPYMPKQPWRLVLGHSFGCSTIYPNTPETANELVQIQRRLGPFYKFSNVRVSYCTNLLVYTGALPDNAVGWWEAQQTSNLLPWQWKEFQPILLGSRALLATCHSWWSSWKHTIHFVTIATQLVLSCRFCSFS